MSIEHVLEEAHELPVIAYVDEKEDERANFYTDAYDSGLFAHIHLINASPNLEDTLAEIFSLEIDAFVTDFNLTEEGAVEYNGERLVEEVLARRKDFPCFIRTSFESDALAESIDVNRVYSKDVTADEHSGNPLFKRVALQIQKHKEQVKSWEEELQKLLGIIDTDRTAKHVERILELDTKLEASIGADAMLPKEVKRELFGTRASLHQQTEKLIEQMKQELGE